MADIVNTIGRASARTHFYNRSSAEEYKVILPFKYIFKLTIAVFQQWHSLLNIFSKCNNRKTQNTYVQLLFIFKHLSWLYFNFLWQRKVHFIPNILLLHFPVSQLSSQLQAPISSSIASMGYVVIAFLTHEESTRNRRR